VALRGNVATRLSLSFFGAAVLLLLGRGRETVGGCCLRLPFVVAAVAAIAAILLRTADLTTFLYMAEQQFFRRSKQFWLFRATFASLI
jgi:hypothetical protein